MLLLLAENFRLRDEEGFLSRRLAELALLNMSLVATNGWVMVRPVLVLIGTVETKDS